MRAALSEVGARLFSASEATVVIAAGRLDVYQVIQDPTTYPDWLAGAQNIRAVDSAFPARGARFEHKVGPAQAITVADDTVSEGARPPEELRLEVHVGPFTGEVEFLLSDLGTGTEVRLRERGARAWAPLMPLLRGPIYLRNRASLSRLRERFAAAPGDTASPGDLED